ncbi:5089_t:CDS:2, partial [Paraglomus occultum]
MAEEGRQDLTPQEKEQERRKKRRELRQKKIIAKAGDRLQQITQTYSLEVPPKSSPANSQQSSPTSTEPPARLTENYNDLSSSYSTDLREKPDAPKVTVSSPSTSNGETTFSFSSSPDRIGSSNDSNFSTRLSHPTPIQQPYVNTTRRRYSTPPSPTTTGTTPPTSGFASFNQPTGDDSDMDQEDYFRQMLENFRARNNSTGSLASTVGGSVTGDMPYYVSSSVAEEPETEDPSQQLDQLPFPFANLPLQFLPPGFTFQMTGQGQREVDVKSKLWDLTHLLVMCGIGLYTVMEEFSVEKGAWSRFASLKRSGESIGYW